MKHIKLLATEHLQLEYNALDDILMAKWSGTLTNNDIKNGYEKISFFLAKQNCHKLLDDHLEVQDIWADLADWVATEWHPEAERLGLHYHACVYSRNVFSRLSTDKTIKMVKKGIVAGFETEISAENWLKAF